MALALYRRYRPDTFDGVIGQNQVTIPLSRALDEGKLTHAYLFSGPRGCGKTSSARILARCINCEKGPTSHPCGVCPSCRDLATNGGGSIDVVEIDAASHNGVDDARELRERAGFAPARDRYKIFILDEAHMVTPQGFNALLKIVEEPPEHVMFIFATTEPEKVIGTIRSRTHHYPFRLVPPEIMGGYLEEICAKESIKPEAGVLKLAMRAGGGSMRDTLSVLDQLMVGAVDGVITYEASVALLGFTPDTLISEAIDAVINHNGENLYSVIEKVIIGGFDPRKFVEDLLARVRDLLVLSLAGPQAVSALDSDAQVSQGSDMQRQAQELGLPALTAMAETISNALSTMVGATSPRMRLELLAAQLLVPMQTAAVGGAGSGNLLTSNTANPATTGATATTEISAQRVGFKGATKKQTLASTQTSTSAPISTPAAEPVETARTVETAESIRLESKSQLLSQSQREPNVIGANTVPAPVTATSDTRSVDERWDDLVLSLPEEIRATVNRDRVPRVALVTKQDAARLYLMFANPTAQHAFSLAVSSEPMDGTTSVQHIVLAEVHKVFGNTTSIGPAKQTATGEHTVPFSKLDKVQQTQVKAQIAALAAGLATSSVQSATAKIAIKVVANNEAHNSHSSHDSQSSSSSQPESSSDQEEDPWANQPHAADIDRAEKAKTESERVQEFSQQSTSRFVKKKVEVPDPKDEEDPWAKAQQQPVQSVQYAQYAHSAQQENQEDKENKEQLQAQTQTSARFQAQVQPPAQPQSQPQVAAEEDDYSLSDERVVRSGAMSLEDIQRMFDAKKVEKFAADDPKNPLTKSARDNRDNRDNSER